MDQAWFHGAVGATTPQGPIPLDMLRKMFADGRLPLDTRVWTEGMTGWEGAASRPEFASQSDANSVAAEPISVAVVDPSFAERPLQALGYQTPGTFVAQYAGLWLRVWAAIIDWIILWAVARVIDAGIMMFMNLAIVPGASGPSQWYLTVLPTSFSTMILRWVYYALMESSSLRATVGKMAIGLLVINDHGATRITFGRATGRHFAKYISDFTMGIGYMMAGWTQKKQALHDLIASTLVVRNPVRWGN